MITFILYTLPYDSISKHDYKIKGLTYELVKNVKDEIPIHIYKSNKGSIW